MDIPSLERGARTARNLARAFGKTLYCLDLTDHNALSAVIVGRLVDRWTWYQGY